MYLQTERLVLRRFTMDDVENLHALDSDPAVMRYLNDGVPEPREAIVTRTLPNFLAWYERSADFGYWAAEEKASGSFIGWFHFRPNRNNEREIELGYRLRTAFWNHGYATEGSRALIRKGFDELHLERIVAKTLLANTASRRVLEKAGMVWETCFIEPRFPGADKRAVRYGIDRVDWAGG